MAKTLVAYFSATGTTGVAATKLASVIGADIFEIVPEVPYTNADLDWRDKQSRSSLEMSNDSSRPAISGEKINNMDEYDTIFLASPVWWYRLSTILNTFLESYDMTGKKIVLFATSGGSKLGDSAKHLEVSAPGAEIISGDVLNGMISETELKSFAEKYV